MSDIGANSEALESHEGLTRPEIGLGYEREMASAAQTVREIPDKSLFRIGEVSRLTATKAFVLRYWESEFPTLEPVKSPSGHRLYRREDIETVFEIKRLLYEEGFTIAGARKHLEEQVADQSRAQEQFSGGGGKTSASPSSATAPSAQRPARQEPASRAHRKFLLDLHEELLAVLTLLERG
jgi:DNA-binding transcriptional MerR regulator